jgi:hypothetical protein
MSAPSIEGARSVLSWKVVTARRKDGAALVAPSRWMQEFKGRTMEGARAPLGMLECMSVGLYCAAASLGGSPHSFGAPDEPSNPPSDAMWY